jgi:2-keto-4-pentenoate hydratase/2-oxohepta-3-ene-1,7-dioic acid hydratase in catechol pathway
MLIGKNLDTTAPTGPYLVTKDEIADPQSTFVKWRTPPICQRSK